MINKGWIKLMRTVLDKPIVMKSTAHFVIWTVILLRAASAPYPKLFKGKEIMLKPGQLITGRKQLADMFGDLNESKVQRVLKDLESEQLIEQQTSSKNRLITVKNWKKYQASEQQNEQQVNTYKNNKEEDIISTKIISSTDLIQESKNKPRKNPSLPRALGGAQADGISLKDIRAYQIECRVGDGDMASTFYHAFVDSGTQFPKSWETVYTMYARAERSKQEQFIDELHKGKYKSRWGERKC